MTKSIEARLKEKSWTVPSGCLEWTGYRTKQGYGKLSFEGKDQPAHRVAWQALHGAIEAGLCVLHHCDNPPCVLDEHLFLGTIADNNRDRDAKGRARGGSFPGVLNPRARLTQAAVQEIRELWGIESRLSLAMRFGVSDATIGHVQRGYSWR